MLQDLVELVGLGALENERYRKTYHVVNLGSWNSLGQRFLVDAAIYLHSTLRLVLGNRKINANKWNDMKNKIKFNQYELCLAMAAFMRENPDSQLTLRLKQCNNQAEQAELFATR